MSTIAELKEEWREENSERKMNGIPRITWATFSLRPYVWRRAGLSKSDSGSYDNGENNAYDND